MTSEQNTHHYRGMSMLLQTGLDSLTSLPDRQCFIEYLYNELEQEPQQQHQSAVMLINLDDFRSINQSLGHILGDEVLKEVTLRLRTTMRDHDLLARMNGDEFALLISDVRQVEEMERLATRLLQVVSAPYEIDGHKVLLHCSIGITVFVCDGRQPSDILQNVETALCRAKDDGKNSYKYYAVEMNTSVQRRLALDRALLAAVQSDLSEFYVVYQPRLNLAAGTITGVEALLRWQSHEFGAVSPCEFIPIAEQNGTIMKLGKWVLEQGCQQVLDWQQAGHTVSIAVNLSARQFRDVNLINTVIEALDKVDIDPELLELELTESMLMHDIAKTVETLRALKNIGIKLAIDDFGTGYSSLSYLKDFPLDYLKIDRSFVSRTADSSREKAIIQTIVNMAHLLDLKVIAEGVETRQQLHFLLAQDCDEMQGFLFSQPVAADNIIAILAEGRKINELLVFPPLTS